MSANRNTTPDWETLPPGYSAKERPRDTRARHPYVGLYTMFVLAMSTRLGIAAFLNMEYGWSFWLFLSGAFVWRVNRQYLLDALAWIGGRR